MSMSEAQSRGGLFAYVKYVAFEVLCAIGLGPIYVHIIGEGYRVMIPPLGQKLYKLPIPGFSNFRHYVETRRLDLAMIMAVFQLLAVWWLWQQILKVLLSHDEVVPHTGWSADIYRRILFSLGPIILIADAALFFEGITQLGWGEAGWSFSAVLATTAYVGVIIFVSLISVILHRPIDGH